MLADCVMQEITRGWPASSISFAVSATTSFTSTFRRVSSSSCRGSPSGCTATRRRLASPSVSPQCSQWRRSCPAPTPRCQRSPTWRASISSSWPASSWCSRRCSSTPVSASSDWSSPRRWWWSLVSSSGRALLATRDSQSGSHALTAYWTCMARRGTQPCTAVSLPVKQGVLLITARRLNTSLSHR